MTTKTTGILKLCAVVVMLAAGTAAHAVSTVAAAMDSARILVGEQTAMHISAMVKPGQRVEFLPYNEELVPGVEIVGQPSTDTVAADDGFIKVTRSLTLTSFNDTLYYIPAQQIKIEGKTKNTNTLALKVLTVEVDTLHMDKFFPPKGVQDNPFSWAEWRQVIIASIAAIVLYMLCICAALRLKSGKPVKLKVRMIKHMPPHQKALSEIDMIKCGKTVATDEKQYYTLLTDTLRRYIEARYGFNAMEMTTADIIARLRQKDDQKKTEELREVFETADLVKFAKHSVGISESDRNLVSAVDFINTTKRDEEPKEERIIPTVTEQELHNIRMRKSIKVATVVLGLAATAVVVYTCWALYDLCC